MKLLDAVDADTGISWWDKNRRKLNEAIEAFNAYQMDPDKTGHKLNVLKAQIQRCRRYGDEHEFSDWQYDLLAEMERDLVNDNG